MWSLLTFSVYNVKSFSQISWPAYAFWVGNNVFFLETDGSALWFYFGKKKIDLRIH